MIIALEECTTDREREAYEAGWNCGRSSSDELYHVRRIACALIRAGEQRYPIAETAWEIWRAIKAGQEEKP